MSSVAIIGVGQTTYRRTHADLSSKELIWAASKEALNDARLQIGDIDLVVAGVAPDALAGEASVERGGIMGRAKPFLRVNTGGVTGSSTVFTGASYIKAGRAKAVLVVALERMGQATTSQQVFNTIFDPVYEKDFPLTTITMAALRASMLMRLYGYTARHWAEIASRSAEAISSRRTLLSLFKRGGHALCRSRILRGARRAALCRGAGNGSVIAHYQSVRGAPGREPRECDRHGENCRMRAADSRDGGRPPG